MADDRTHDNDPSPWIPENNQIHLAVLGKAIEEVSELSFVVSQIGFLSNIGSALRQDLHDEIADVRSLMHHLDNVLGLTVRNTDPSYTEDVDRDAGAALSKLNNILGRIIIQGIDESDPKSNVPNRIALQGLIHDVRVAMLDLIYSYQLDLDHIEKRAEYKYQYLGRWLRQLGYTVLPMKETV